MNFPQLLPQTNLALHLVRNMLDTGHIRKRRAFVLCLLGVWCGILLATPSALADLPPDVKSALEVIKAHRAEAERVVKDVKGEASKPITIAGVPGQPQPRPTDLERSLQPGYSDQADSYNRIITALKNGNTSVANPFNNTSVPLNDAIRDAVHFSGIWFRGAEQSLGKSYAPPTEAMLSSEWANIVQAISSLSSGDRKKLQKKLDKECRWRTWPNVN